MRKFVKGSPPRHANGGRIVRVICQKRQNRAQHSFDKRTCRRKRSRKMNRFIVMGRIASDLNLQTTPNGINFCKFRIAVERNFQQKGEEKKTDFFNAVAWRGTAELPFLRLRCKPKHNLNCKCSVLRIFFQSQILPLFFPFWCLGFSFPLS